MGASLYSGEPVGDPAGVPCDPESWSEESKWSVAYSFPPTAYRDKAYLCWRCREPECSRRPIRNMRSRFAKRASRSSASCVRHATGIGSG